MTAANHPPHDLNDNPLTAMRRRDRAVEDEGWIKTFLHRAPYGVLASVDGDQPFINTNLFVYDEDAHTIYLHSARHGRLRSNIEHNPRVCFSVMEMGRLLPADVALEFSLEFASVVVFGEARVIEDQETARQALQRLLDKYAPHLRPGDDYRPPVEPEIKRTSVYELRIEAWSGKKKEVAADFPGAYWYESEPMIVSRQAPDAP